MTLEGVPRGIGARRLRATALCEVCQIKLMFRLKGLLKPGEIATPDAEGTLTALNDLSFCESLGAQNSLVMRRNFEPAIE